MGGNVAEFTTEVKPNINDSSTDEPVVLRGGRFTNFSPAGQRSDFNMNSGGNGSGLRITLFLN